MTNLAGIAPIEQTKALTHIMHYSIHVNFYAQTSAQFERIKISPITSQAIQLDVQGKDSNRFALSWLCSFFHAMVSDWDDNRGMVLFLHSI